jgi:hypothetical protein
MSAQDSEVVAIAAAIFAALKNAVKRKPKPAKRERSHNAA